MRPEDKGDEQVDAKKLAAIKAMLEDYVPGDDEDMDADMLLLIATMIKTKGRNDS